MQRFASTISGKFNALFFLALFVGSAYFTLNVPNRSMVETGTVVFGLLSAFAGWMAWTALVAASAVYELDEDRITRRSLTGTQSLRWSELARYTTTSSPYNRCLILIDARGQKLVVQWGAIRRQAEMSALLQPRLSAVHESQLREVGSSDRVYYPTRNVAWIGMIMVVMSAAMLFAYAPMPARPSEMGAKIGLLVMAGFAALFFLGLTLYFYTNTLTITAYDITQSSLFRTRQIPFHHVTSVMSREVSVKNGTINQTVIEGDGKKMMLNSQMKDYGLLVDYIQRQVDAPAREQGQAAAQALNIKETQRNRVILPILGLLIFAGFAGLGAMQLQQGNDRLARYRLMDTQGATAVGQISGLSMDGPKGYRYLIEFAFTDDEGQPRQSASMVTRDDYNSAQIGAPINVIYVRGRSTICRIPQSIGKRKAEGDIRTGYLYIAMGFVLTPLGMYGAYRDLKRRSAASTLASK